MSNDASLFVDTSRMKPSSAEQQQVASSLSDSEGFVLRQKSGHKQMLDVNKIASFYFFSCVVKETSSPV